MCDCAFCFWDWRAGCMVPDLCLSAQCWDKLLRCNSKNFKQQRPEYLDFFFIRGMSQAPKTLEPTFPIRQLKLWGPWFYSTWWMNTCYHPGKGNNIQLSIWEDTWVNMLNCSSTQSDETSSSQPQIQPTHLTSNCNTINVVLLQFPWSSFMVQCEKPTWMTVVAIKTKPVSQHLPLYNLRTSVSFHWFIIKMTIDWCLQPGHAACLRFKKLRSECWNNTKAKWFRRDLKLLVSKTAWADKVIL